MALSHIISVQQQSKPKHQTELVLPPADNPFFYGWREVVQQNNGTEELVRVPLTLDDVLHPQLGDYILQNPEHFAVCDDLFDGLKGHLLPYEPKTVLLHDVLIDWEEEGLRAKCPDIAVVRNVEDMAPKSMFFLKRARGHIDLILEVTSPTTWKIDVEGEHHANKVIEYAKAGVPCYIIVDDQHRNVGQSPPIIAYQLGKRKRYERMKPDKRGWYWIETVQLWIGPYRDWVSWYDKDGNKIGTYLEECEARKRAEDKIREEAEARKRAEDKIREEAEARKRAEDKVRLAEERIRQLEALLGKADEQSP